MDLQNLGPKARPILKWAGGKTQLINNLLSLAPTQFNKYIEPFFGGGALFYALEHPHAIISDINEELIELYLTITSDVENVIEELSKMPIDKSYFLELREKDVKELSNVERAARTIYLNKTCYNGLYRVNKKGKFNVPYGNYKNPNTCDAENLRSASEVLKTANIVKGSYKEVLNQYAKPGDFIFLDPPYLPISESSNFKRYTPVQFGEEDHIELANEVKRLHQLGCYVLLTNSNHPLVHELYSEFARIIIPTKRYINSKGNKRMGEDVIVTTFW